MTPLPYPGKQARAVPGAVRLAVVAVLSALVLLGGNGVPARSEADAKQIAKLIEELGDDDIDTRKAAEKKLADIGEEALPQLRKAAKNHLDADVRLRAVVLVRGIEKGSFGEIRKFTNHTGAVRHIAVSRDGKKALVGSQDKNLWLYDIDTGKELKKMTGHTGYVWQVAFSPDDKQALSSGSFDKTLRLWNLEDGKEVRKYQPAAPPPATVNWWVYGAAFSPDGKQVVSGGTHKDPVLRLYEADTGKEIRKFEGHTGWIWKVAFSPNGKKIASAGSTDYSYRIWDVETGKVLINGENAHDGWVVGLAFSPDGKHLLTSGRDLTIKLWDAETGKLVRSYTGMGENVESLAFSKDGKRFLAGEYKVVHLFDTASGKILHRFEDHGDWVFAVAFVDDRHALSGGGESDPKVKGDNSLRLWGLPK